MMNRRDRELERRLEGRRRRGICNFDLFDQPDPPAPDPAIGAAAQNNVELGKQSLDFAKEQYADSRPRQANIDALTDQVVQGALQQQQKSSALADDYETYRKTVFQPIEQSLADEANAFDSDAKREQLAAQAGADVEQATAASDATARRDAARYGANPADGAFADQLAGSSINRTAAKVGAMNAARTAARAEGRALKFDVAGLGRGLAGAGATSAQLGVQAGNAALNAGQAPAANARADTAQMQAGYGAAIGANQSAANIYSGLYGQQLSAYNAGLANDSATFGGIGSLAGQLGGAYLLSQGGAGAAAGAGLFRGSSKKIKTNKKPIAAAGVFQKIKKLPVERWDYRKGVADEATHIGPYAEDVQRHFGDVAAPGGKMIDLISMNGIALAGVKAVAAELDALKRGMRPKDARRGVKRPHLSRAAAQGVK